jgi:hypothetical protein
MDDNQQTSEHVVETGMVDGIYVKLSSQENSSNFDVNTLLLSAHESVKRNVHGVLKSVETKVLLNDVTTLNNVLVASYKDFKHKTGFNNLAIVFTAYCDYFGTDYHDTYTRLHDKMKEEIKRTSVTVLGHDVMDNMNRLHGEKKEIPTLAELLKIKREKHK